MTEIATLVYIVIGLFFATKKYADILNNKSNDIEYSVLFIVIAIFLMFWPIIMVTKAIIKKW